MTYMVAKSMNVDLEHMEEKEFIVAEIYIIFCS